MTKNFDAFIKAIDYESIKEKHPRRAHIPYGSIIIPILRIYKDLSDYEEKRSFEAALEAFLTSPDEEKRRFALDICLGFLIFKDDI